MSSGLYLLTPFLKTSQKRHKIIDRAKTNVIATNFFWDKKIFGVS